MGMIEWHEVKCIQNFRVKARSEKQVQYCGLAKHVDARVGCVISLNLWLPDENTTVPPKKNSITLQLLFIYSDLYVPCLVAFVRKLYSFQILSTHLMAAHEAKC